MRVALLLLLLSGPALADDAPRKMRLVAPGHVITEPTWLLTVDGKKKLDDYIAQEVQRVAKLEAEKAECGEVPALTWRGAVGLIGLGILIGGVAAIAVHQTTH